MYIDPSAGSLVLQVVAAVGLSALAFIGRARQAARAFFTSMFTRRRSR
jgi:hypothetical protein